MLGSEIIHVGRRGSSEHKIWALHQINPILVFWLLRHQHTNIQASSYAPRCVSIQEGNYQMASFSIVHSSETGRLTKWSDRFDRCYDRNTTETPVKCQSDAQIDLQISRLRAYSKSYHKDVWCDLKTIPDNTEVTQMGLQIHVHDRLRYTPVLRCHRGLYYYHGLIQIPAWISNYIHYQML